MSSNLKHKSFFVISLNLFLLITAPGAENIQFSVDTNEAIEQVNHNFTEPREGEFLIDTNIVYCPHPKEQDFPAIAFDDTRYLVVWQDDRNGNWDIYGSLVNQSGNVIDTLGIEISVSPGYQQNPSIAFDGSNYLVVWQDSSNGDWDICGVRVDQSGTVLDTSDIDISVEIDAQTAPDLTFNGMDYLVVWQDNRNGDSDIYGARIDQSGIVIDSSGIAVSLDSTMSLKSPKVDFDGTNYLVVWASGPNSNEYHHLYAARVSQSGIVLDSIGIHIFTGVEMCEWRNHSLSFDGTNYLITWPFAYVDGPHHVALDIYGARINQSGIVIDTNYIDIYTNGSGFDFSPRLYTSVAFDGNCYLVTFVTWVHGYQDQIYGKRVDRMGNVIEPTITISNANGQQYCPSLVFATDVFFVVWRDKRTGISCDVIGARVDTSGSVLDSTGIVISSSYSVNPQYTPAICSNGRDYLVVWIDQASQDIHGSRVSQLGSILDSSTIIISSSYPHPLEHPSVAFDGTNYFVVWKHSSAIRGARVRQSGAVLDSSGIDIATGLFYDPAIAFDGTNYLVVYYRKYYYDYTHTCSRIQGVLVNQSGSVIIHFPITDWAEWLYCQFPAIAFDGTNYLVVYKKTGNFGNGVFGKWVSPSGGVIIPEILIVAGGDYTPPALAFDGANYLVVWQQTSDIYGRRVSPSGNFIDSVFAICTAPNQQEDPDVTYDGTHYLVVWQDKRNNIFDIYGAEIDTSGTVIDSHAVSLQSGDQISPVVSHGSGDQLLIAYSGWTDSIGSHSAEIMRIWGKLYPFVGIKEDIKLKNQVTRLDLQVYPNPINKKCNIKYILLQEMSINISVFDVTGRFVKDVINETQKVGIYCRTFDVDDLPQGVYFIRLEAENYSDTKKVIFIK